MTRASGLAKGLVSPATPAKISIEAAIARHRQLELDLVEAVGALSDLQSGGHDTKEIEQRLESLFADQERARSDVISFPVLTLREFSAKAEYVTSLIAEGDESFDATHWRTLLQSFVLR